MEVPTGRGQGQGEQPVWMMRLSTLAFHPRLMAVGNLMPLRGALFPVFQRRSRQSGDGGRKLLWVAEQSATASCCRAAEVRTAKLRWPLRWKFPAKNLPFYATAKTLPLFDHASERTTLLLLLIRIRNDTHNASRRLFGHGFEIFSTYFSCRRFLLYIEGKISRGSTEPPR